MQYFGNLSKNFGIRNMSINGHTGLEQIMIKRTLDDVNDQLATNILRIPTKSYENNQLASKNNSNMNINSASIASLKDKSTGLQNLNTNSRNSRVDLDLNPSFKAKITPGLDLTNS